MCGLSTLWPIPPVSVVLLFLPDYDDFVTNPTISIHRPTLPKRHGDNFSPIRRKPCDKILTLGRDGSVKCFGVGWIFDA